MQLSTQQALIVARSVRAALPELPDDDRPEGINLVVRAMKSVWAAQVAQAVADLDAQLKADDFVDHNSFGVGRFKPKGVPAIAGPDYLDLDDDQDDGWANG